MSKNLDQLRQVAESATPGPWEACSERDADGTRRYTVNPERELDTDICAVEYGVPGSANVEFIATFDPPTVLALIERAEAAERALDFHTQRDHELKTLLSVLADRLDEFCYDELSSLIEDGPLNQWSEKYTSKLHAAEAAVQRVRELAEKWISRVQGPVQWVQLLDMHYELTRALDGGE